MSAAGSGEGAGLPSEEPRPVSVPRTVQVDQVDWDAEPREEEEGAIGAIKLPSAPTVEQHRETTRSRLAIWLLALTSATVLSILLIGALQLAGVLKHSGPTTTDLADSLLTPVITITATALGFYFGAQTAAGSSDEQRDSGAGDWPGTAKPGLVRRAWRRFW